MVRVRGNTYVESIGATDIGIYMLDERNVVLIDSGEYPSEEFMGMLCEETLFVRAILQTHMHIDHIGNNESLVREFGAPVIADEADAEDVALWGMTLPYPVRYEPCGHTSVIDGRAFGTIRTPGHSPGHQLIITPDEVCFLGDVIMSEEALAMAKMPYRRRTKESLDSIRFLYGLPYDCYVAAHRGILDQAKMRRSAELNIKKEEELLEVLESLIPRPIPLLELETAYMNAVHVNNPHTQREDYMHVSARGRIEELERRGRIRIREGWGFPSSTDARPL